MIPKTAKKPETSTRTPLPQTSETETRRNHDALMQFFADAEKNGAQNAPAHEDDTEPLFVPDLFTPELSEPLSIREDAAAENAVSAPPMADMSDTADVSAAVFAFTEEELTVTEDVDCPVLTESVPEKEPVEASVIPSDTPSDHTSADTDDALPTEELPCAEDDAAEPKVPLLSPRVLRTVGIVCAATLSTLVLAFATLTGILFFESRAQTVDLDARPTLGLIEENALFASLSAYTVTPDGIDTSKISDASIDLTFWGFLPRTARIAVRDLTPPTVSVYRITQPRGFLLTPEHCVASYADKTAVTFAFEAEPDANLTEEQTIHLLATDEGGNTTVTPVTVRILSKEESEPVFAEFGATRDTIAAILEDNRPTLTDFDLFAVDTACAGDYYITGTNLGDETSRHITHLSLKDTKPPVGRVHSYTYAAANMTQGGTFTPEQFVTEITDASPVTLAFKKAPDYEKYETQEIVVSATDDAGNATDFFCQLQLLDIPAEITVECGTPTEDFLETLLQNVTEEDRPAVVRPLDTAAVAPGNHTLLLRGKYSTLTVNVTARDTVPPVLTLSPATAYIGNLPDPATLVSSLSDATEVTLSYLATPDVTKEGTVGVTVVATDAGGNRTKAETTLTVVPDTLPPVLYGVQNIYAQENSTVSYRKGVTAYDAADGAVAVKVDASAVDITKSGSYVITYTATDKAGNVATQKAKVFVTGANQTTINMYADQILSSILTSGMTERQKASAIYKWSVGHIRYSTSTSHLMDKYLQAAYSGFATHAGNCYTYYAVTAALLTRAGIENMEIRRNIPTDPHYWNLVKIDGSWYHLDTCPKMKKFPIETFLLTDRQVADYSKNQVENYYSFDASLYPATP